jgi:hypothetical protein
MHHPNVHKPWSQWSEDQTIHIACAYVNPFRWEKRRKLFEDFRRRMVSSPNVVLHVGELAYGDRPFEVTTADDPHAVQLRTNSEMWHKENVLNRVVQSFPAGWKYGGYWDADMHPVRHDWALEAIHKLQHHPWVQLFSSYGAMSHEHRPLSLRSSFAYNYVNRLGAFGAADRNPDPCDGYVVKISAKAEPPYPGAPGGAWGFTQDSFSAVGGFLDTCILGSGDWHMAWGLVGEKDNHVEMKRCAPGYVDSIHRWQARAFNAVRGNIGYVDCFATHGFHGSYKTRGYGTRSELLVKHKYDPQGDVFRDWQGVYRWSGKKPLFEMEVRRYFTSRAEDDISLAPGDKHMV